MKILRIFGLILLAISLCLSACGEIENPIEPTPDQKPEEVKSEITIDADIITNGLSFTSATGEKSISFTTNEDWTLSIATTQNGDAWCSASTTSGAKGDATVKFSVTENTSYDDRSVSVTIKSGTASKTFTITQKYAEALLLTTNKYEVGKDGGTIEIEVKSNINYEMVIADNAKSWISETATRAMTTHKHNLNISANKDGNKREGEIHFKSGDRVETVKVYQAGNPTLILSENEYFVEATGGIISVHIRSNVDFEVQMPDVDWITEVSTRAMSSHYLEYNIAPNEESDIRSAEIIFYDMNSDLKETLKVVQEQKDAIIISEKNISVESEGGIIEVKVKSSVDFQVHPYHDWVSVVETRALTESSVFLSIDKNTGISDRSTKVEFVNYSEGIYEIVVITQHCSTLEAAVTIEEAGTLKKLLGDDYKKVASLKITGPINGDDIYNLRKMLGCRDFSAENWGCLRKLDLSEASIVEGGESYDGSYYGYTTNNIIGSSMFDYSENLQEIQLPQNITAIEGHAFCGCKNLKDIVLPDSVTSLGNWAFGNCQLSSITIPRSLTSISQAAFCYGTDSNVGTAVHIKDLEAWLNIDFEWYHSNPLANGGKLYLNGDELTELTIPESVTEINNFAFYGCDNIVKVIMGEWVTLIGAGAFTNCYNISEFYCYATTPPRLDYTWDSAGNYATAFGKNGLYWATLYVPERCSSKYSGWGFRSVIEME